MSYPIHKIPGGSGSAVTRTERGFQGLDTGGGGIGRAMSRAADTLNLIWEGEALRRRPCCSPWLQVDAPIYGIYPYQDQLLIHAGERLLRYPEADPAAGEPEMIFAAMNQAPSRGVIRRQQVEERCCSDQTTNGWSRRRFEGELLFICDGKNYLFYDGEQVRSCIDENWGAGYLPDNACFYSTVPATAVAKLPAEGSGDVDPRGDNLLSQFHTESFYVGTDETQNFILNCPLNSINADIPFEIRLRDDSGLWRQVICIKNYSFSRDPAGARLQTDLLFKGGMAITLDEQDRVTAVQTGGGEMALDGSDNITITYAVRKDWPASVAGATVMGLFGPDGSNSVLFLGGSAQKPGLDHFSAPDDFLCFHETCYEQLGNADAPITGYCPLKDGRLAVLKNDPGESAVYFRSHQVVEVGATLSGESYLVDAYPSVAGAAVEGCVSAATVGWAGNEPCFLTARGLYTVRTVSDELINLNETLLRSRAVEELLKQLDPASANALNWQELYLLFFGSTVLVTDGRTDSEGSYRFMRWQLPLSVSAAARIEDVLLLGGEEGVLYRMSEDQPEEVFSAYWKTPAMEESSGLKMIFQRLELLITPGDQPETSFTLFRNGQAQGTRLLKLRGSAITQWIPIASRFGRGNTLAVQLLFPPDKAFRLWGLRIVYRKGKRR